MPVCRYGFLLLLAVLPAAADRIDLAMQPSVLLRPGDALEFTFSASSYRAYTGADPSRLAFVLATLPFAELPSFSASLDAADGSFSAPFGVLQFDPGYYRSSQFTGPVSTVSGDLPVSTGIATLLRGPAILTLRNTGAEVTLGLPPYSVSHDLSISLSGGGISVGGIVLSAALRTASPLLLDSGMNMQDGPVNPVPEPSSAGLFGAGGALLACLGWVLKARFRGPRG